MCVKGQHWCTPAHPNSLSAKGGDVLAYMSSGKATNDGLRVRTFASEKLPSPGPITSEAEKGTKEGIEQEGLRHSVQALQLATVRAHMPDVHGS